MCDVRDAVKNYHLVSGEKRGLAAHIVGLEIENQKLKKENKRLWDQVERLLKTCEEWRKTYELK